MPGEILVFDAAGSNPDGTDPGTALNIGPGTLYGLRACAFPAPSQSVTWAGSMDTEGSVPAARKHENRTISLTIMCATAAALRTLQGKIGKIAREGGTLKWVLPNAEVGYFDLDTADTYEPKIEARHYSNGNAGAYCDAEITLMGRPYGRTPAAAVTLSSSTATSKQPLVATATGLKGDVFGLGTLTLQNVTNAKQWAIWGVQSRYYSSAAGAALFLEAENAASMLFSGAALNAGAAGASGGGANKVVRHTDVGTSGAANSLYVRGSGDVALTHVGTYRVFARVQALSTNTGTCSVACEWSPTALSSFTLNDWVPIVDSAGAVIKGSWVLVDMGLVTIPLASFGTQSWEMTPRVKSTVATDDLDWDWFMLVPCDEGSGRVAELGNNIEATGSVVAGPTFTKVVGTGSTWFDPTSFEGDYLKVPPAGAEGRTLRIIALVAGATGNSLNRLVIPADNLDAFTAALTYAPRYLSVPTP